MASIVIDTRGLKDKKPFLKVRDALGLCTEEQMIDVLADSEAQARKIMSFMAMSGCIVVMEKTAGGWMLRMTGRNCRCG